MGLDPRRGGGGDRRPAERDHPRARPVHEAARVQQPHPGAGHQAEPGRDHLSEAAMNGKLLSLGGSLRSWRPLTAAGAPEASRDVKGTWSLNNWIPGSSVHLTLKHKSGSSRWQWGTDQPLSDLRGLTKDQLHAASSPVKFTLARDAGTFSFEGSVMMGLGTGEFGFTPDPTFAAKLQRLRLRDRPRSRPLRDGDPRHLDRVRLRGHAIGDQGGVGTRSQPLPGSRRGAFVHPGAHVDRLRRTSVPTTSSSSEITASRPTSCGALKAAGYGDLASSDIVKLRDHGVDAAYIEGLAGLRLARGCTPTRSSG